MIDQKETEALCDEVWNYLANIFMKEEVSGASAASVMLTITARFWNNIILVTSRESLQSLKEDFMDIIDEKIGKKDE